MERKTVSARCPALPGWAWGVEPLVTLALGRRRETAVGDRVWVRPSMELGHPAERQTGTVTYLHPERRYYLVTLDKGGRQAFLWGQAE